MMKSFEKEQNIKLTTLFVSLFFFLLIFFLSSFALIIEEELLLRESFFINVLSSFQSPHLPAPLRISLDRTQSMTTVTLPRRWKRLG